MFPKSLGVFLWPLLLLLTSPQTALTNPQHVVKRDIQSRVAQLPTSFWIDPPRPYADAGNPVSLICTAFRGYPRTILSWSYGEERRPLQGTMYHQSDGPNDTDYTRLVLNTSIEDNGATIYCTASNPFLDEIKETSVVLTVLGRADVVTPIAIKPEAVTPSTNQQHVNDKFSLWINKSTVEAGKNIELSCGSFDANSSTVLSWSYGENRIPLTAASYYQSPDKLNPTYTTVVLKPSIGDVTVYCTAWYLGKIIKENSFKLNVVEPEIRIEPETVNVLNGAAVHMRCIVTGDVDQGTITWFRSGIQLAVSSVYTIDPATPLDQGIYTCVAYLRSGNIVQTNVSVNVISPPSVTFDSDKIVVNMYEKLTITCHVSPKPQSGRIYWQRPGSNLHTDLDKETLVIENALPEDAGVYQCTSVTKMNGETFNSSASVRVEVQYKPESAQITPGRSDVLVNDKLKMLCSAFVEGWPSPTYRWWKRGKEGDTLSTSSELTIPSVQVTDAGDYYCQISNRVGSPSAVATVRVWQNDRRYYSDTEFLKVTTVGDDVRPEYLNQLDRSALSFVGVTRVSAQIGSDSDLKCHRKAPEMPMVRWTFKDIVIDFSSKYYVDYVRLVGDSYVNTLTIRDVQKSDYGMYVCNVWNYFGKNLSVVWLEPPVRLTAPTNLKLIDVRENSVTLTWNYFGTPGQLAPVNYRLLFKSEWSGLFYEQDCNGRNPCTVGNLISNHLYSFQVRAEDENSISVPSNTIKVRTGQKNSNISNIPPARDCVYDAASGTLTMRIETGYTLVAFVESYNSDEMKWMLIKSFPAIAPVTVEPLDVPIGSEKVRVRLCQTQNAVVCSEEAMVKIINKSDTHETVTGNIVNTGKSFSTFVIYLIIVGSLVIAALVLSVVAIIVWREKFKSCRTDSKTKSSEEIVIEWGSVADLKTQQDCAN